MEESYDLDLATRASTRSTVERDSDSCSITSLIDGYYFYSLPTIEEEDVEMDDPDALEDEDLEIFWRGILKPGHNRRRTVYEEHTQNEEMGEDEDDILTRRMSLSRQNHEADSSNVTSFFSSCSTIDECPEDVVQEPGGRENTVQSVSASESDIYDYPSPSTSISTPNTPSKSKHPKPSSKPNFLSTPPARKPPKLLSPLTKLPKRLSESLSSISLPYSSRRRSNSSHNFLPRDSHSNTESPPTLDIRPSPEFYSQLPETSRYSKYSNHDSWTSTISTPSLQYSTVSSLSSSPISSPTSSSFSRSFPPSESLKENLNSNFVGVASPSSMSGFKSSFMRRKPAPDFDDDDTRSWLPEMVDVGGFRSTAPLRIVKRRSSKEQSLSS